MSYSDNPVLDAARYFDVLHQREEAQEAAEYAASGVYLAACQICDANALADFAPRTTDWDAAKRNPLAAGSPRPMRLRTLAEVLDDSLDYGNGPTRTELMRLVLDTAYGADLVNAPAKARSLLLRMAQTWAGQNVVEVAE